MGTPNNDAVSQDFIESEMEKNHKERQRAEVNLGMGQVDDDFMDGLVEESVDDKSAEELIFIVADKVKLMQNRLAEQSNIICDQNNAIVMLKDYILTNGLKPFWETSLKKPVGQMTKEELIASSKASKNEYRRATSPDTTPFPTFEEQEKMYKQRNSPEIDALIGLMEKGPQGLPIGSDEKVGGPVNIGDPDRDDT
jgi:hypothetical protein